jgi:hypothetical protein
MFLSESTRAALTRLSEADAATDRDPLDRLRDIRSLITALEADQATIVAVREALESGSTWDDIADEIATRHEAGRKRAARPSSVPTDLPGLSVAEAANKLGVSVQAVYLQVSRGTLRAETVTLPDGRSYKRVFPG